MESTPELITVFRATGDAAEDEAKEVRDQLLKAGIDARLTEDRDAEAWDVRVPEDRVGEAAQLLAVAQPEASIESIGEDVDPSPDLDPVTIYSSPASLGELEAMAVKSLLNAAGIPAFVIGASTLPNLEFDVRVPREFADEAQRILDEAAKSGPKAAEEAEQASEENPR